jgi:pimeloyl-ACP methyl ester carboxylesterase
MKKYHLISLLFLALTLTAIGQATDSTDPGFAVEMRGAGSPILFIPGLSCKGEVWHETAASLSETHRCHIISLPGFAGQPGEEWSQPFLETMRDRIIAYIRHQRLDRPVLVGHSLGGFLGLMIAIEEPDLLGRLIIVDALPFLPGTQNPSTTADSMKPMAKNLRNQIQQMARLDEATRRTQGRMMLASMITDPDRVETALDWSIASDPDTVAQAIYEMMTTDLRPSISAITVPTLVLGAANMTTPELARNIYAGQYANVTNLTLHVSGTGKHFLMWDAPQWTQNHIQQFVTGQ